MNKPVPVSSREARVAQDACCNLSCRLLQLANYNSSLTIRHLGDNSRAKCKVFRCNGCQVMIYCVCHEPFLCCGRIFTFILQSPTCQRAHYPVHKGECKVIRKQKEALLAAPPSTESVISPAQVSKECHAFVHYFGPFLAATAVNWFRPARSDPVIRGWEDEVLLLNISRRSDVPPKAPTWAHFKVDGIRRITLTDLHAAFSDNSGYQLFREARVRQIREAKRRGPGHGILDTWISCSFGGGRIQAAYPQFFGPRVADSDYLPPRMTPASYFKAVVDTLSAQASK